jgi:hypothetical protein
MSKSLIVSNKADDIVLYHVFPYYGETLALKVARHCEHDWHFAMLSNGHDEACSKCSATRSTPLVGIP